MQETSSNTALVTGATGFIGGHMARLLIKEGWRIKLLVRDISRLPDELSGAEIIQGDLADHSALASAVSNVSVIFHCAAKVDSWGTQESYRACNVTGVQNLLKAIVEKTPDLKRLVHLSTVDVYGFPKQPCNEDSPFFKTGFGYGNTKAEGEVYLRDFCEENKIPYTVIRPCNVIGPNSQFIGRIGDQLRSGLMLKIDNGRYNAGIVDVDTLTNYMLWAASSERAESECYNIRDDYEVTWSELITYFSAELKSKAFILNLPFFAADVISRFFVIFNKIFLPSKEPLIHPLIIRIFGRTCGHNIEKIKMAKPDHKVISFDEAMQKSIAWYKANKI